MAVWDTAYINDLPDSCFLYIESGGTKDETGRTTPRSLRHFPVKDSAGNIDMPHLRNALSRIPQANISQAAKDAATRKANGMMPGRASFDRAVPVVADMEFRAAADGGWDFSGYAALFDTPSDASWMPYREIVRSGAFTRALNSRRAHGFVVNHDDNLLLASTRTDRLHLTQDSKGLLTEAKLPGTSYANDLRELHAAGETRGMSFTFKPEKDGEHWTDSARELTNLQLGHVTVVTTLEPAYSATQRTLQFRALSSELAADADELEGLLDAIREGRGLSDGEFNLLDRLAAHYRPEQSVFPPAGANSEATLARWKSVLAEKESAPA